MKKRHSQKLARRYYGPFQVLRRIGPVAYELDLPPTAKINRVFHVSLLRPCCGKPEVQVLPLPERILGNQPVLEPRCVLGQRVVTGRQGSQDQVLVQWENSNESKATWEEFADFSKQFPNIDLVDKVSLEGVGTDKDINSSPKDTRPKRNISKPKWMKDFKIN